MVWCILSIRPAGVMFGVWPMPDTMDLRQGLRLGLAMAKAAAHGVVC